jgi:uncharacterized membrane protein YqjE
VSSPLDGLRRLAVASAALLLTRAEFASLELAQARVQFMRWLGMALGASMLAALGAIALSAALAIALWPQWGWVTLVLLGLVYLLGSLWLMRQLLREVREAPPVLSQTLEELARDREALLPGGRGVERPSGPP